MANRHKSRQSALEILYAWNSSAYDDTAIPDLLAGRIALKERNDQDQVYLREMVQGVITQYEVLDEVMTGAVRRSLKSVAHIELNVLRLAIWELRERPEIPYRVCIDEALQLTHSYADESACGFINGVLDKLARTLRPQEVSSAPQQDA